MALSVNISVNEQNDALSFDTIDNTVYGGSGNPAIGDILTANLIVTLPNSTVPFTIPILLSTFITMGTIPFNVTASSFGLSILPDGVYVVSLILTYAIAPTTSIGTVTVGFVATVNCCIQKKLANISIDDDCGCCEGSDKMKALEAYTDLCTARAAIQFGLINIFNKFLIRLQKICKNCGCNG